MGLTETVLLTAGIVIVDVLLLNEYLKLEDKLAKLKEPKPIETSKLQAMVQEVEAPLPDIVISETSQEEFKTPAERENEQLKAQNAALLEEKQVSHKSKFDELAAKLDDILKGLQGARQKVSQSA